MARSRETELYGPVKAFLEGQGLEVKAEVGPADVVGIDDDRTVKSGFSRELPQTMKTSAYRASSRTISSSIISINGG